MCRFLQPFAGVGYGMGVGIILNPAHADYNGGAIAAGTYYWGGVHGTWFWIDPVNDLIVVGMVQQVLATGVTVLPLRNPPIAAKQLVRYSRCPSNAWAATANKCAGGSADAK